METHRANSNDYGNTNMPMYVSDVLVVEEFFPDPYLSLNATTILVAFLSFLTGEVLMFLAERMFAEKRLTSRKI